MITKVISGGQRGADIAALKAAKAAGIETGGWMPLGFLTLDGPKPEYEREYGVTQTDSVSYPKRTMLNVQFSDGTIRFATDWKSRGELATMREIERFKRPYYDVDPARISGDQLDAEIRVAASWVIAANIGALNVAGNASEYIGEFTEEFLAKMFTCLRKRHA